MPRRRRPTDGPTKREALLDEIQGELQAIYDRLGRLADRLERDDEAAEDDPEWLAAMAWRMSLSEIRSHALSAKHCTHGGLIAVVRARPEAAAPRRQPP